MRHKNTLFFTVLTSLALVFTMGAKGGCGVTGLNKSEVKGKAAEELPQADIDALDVFGTKKLKDLTSAEQDQVVDIVFKHLTKTQFVKLAKQFCHLDGLFEDECKEVRGECLDGIRKTDAEALQTLKSKESELKAGLKKTFEKANFAPSDITKIFKVVVAIAEKATQDLECSSSDEQRNKMLSDFMAPHGGMDEFDRLIVPASIFIEVVKFSVASEEEAKAEKHEAGHDHKHPTGEGHGAAPAAAPAKP